MRYVFFALAVAVVCMTGAQIVTATSVVTNSNVEQAAIDIQALTLASKNLPEMVVADPI